MDRRPIGVFDSGLGGLTFVRELKRVLPEERLVYFGDTGRVPYGTHSAATIERYASQDCEFLLRQNVKAIVAACGTVSTVAGAVLRRLPVPAMGILEPTAEAALAATRTGRIGVLGTTATVHSGAFSRYITEHRPDAAVYSQACPVLVSLVESGWVERDNTATEAVTRRYLEPFMDKGVDTVILGCTHFPLLTPIFSQILGDSVTLINSGEACARHCEQMLRRTDALCDSRQGEDEFFVSDRPSNFEEVATMFLGHAVEAKLQPLDETP